MQSSGSDTKGNGFPDFDTFLDQSSRYLTKSIDNRDLLREALEVECSWHPSGFAVFRLGSIEGFGQLRLHVWPTLVQRERKPSPTIHSHVWHLNSKILAGAYTEILYSLADGGGIDVLKVESGRIQYSTDPNRIETQPARFLRQNDAISCGPGESHSIPAGAIHETTIENDEFAATLMLTSQTIQEYAFVFSVGNVHSGTNHRPFVSFDDRHSIVQELADSIGHGE